MRGARKLNADETVAIWDHPRGCGEHIPVLLIRVNCDGSSPRMRGALDWLMCSLRDFGIIPADAGSTKVCVCSIYGW